MAGTPETAEPSAAASPPSEPHQPATTATTPTLPPTADPLPGYAVTRREVTWQDLDAAADIEKLGCLSPVLTPNGPWYDRHLLIPHSVIRFDLLLLERAVQPQYFQPQRAWKVRRLFAWYRQYFYKPVHHHHDTEEGIYFPWLTSNPRCRIPPRMAADHKQMIQLMDDILAMQAMFAAPGADLQALAAELRKKVATLGQTMRQHLNEEEQFIPPLLRDCFTEQQGNAIAADKIVPSRGLDNLWLLPAEVRNQQRTGGQESVQYLLRMVPRPIRWHHDKFAASWYDAENVGVINSLLIDSDTEPAKRKHRGFGVLRWYA